eukprot:3871276-Prymnesium_polylepis.1
MTEQFSRALFPDALNRASGRCSRLHVYVGPGIASQGARAFFIGMGASYNFPIAVNASPSPHSPPLRSSPLTGPACLC